MAIYHVNFKICKRSDGKSSVYLSAYQNRQKFTDDRTGQIFDYSSRIDLHHTEIMAPEGSPLNIIKSSSSLWNEVEKVEKRKDAQLCRYFDVAIPKELNNKQKIKVVKDYVKRNFVDEGMIADLAFHDLDGDNPHCHVMLTMREITPEGFGKKVREWNDKDNMDIWRKDWETTANRHLKAAGHKSRIDSRSLKEQHQDALRKAESAEKPKGKAKYLAMAIETDREPMKRIFRMNWRQGMEQRSQEQQIREDKKREAKEVYKTLRNLDLQIIINPDEIRLEAPKPQPQEVEKKPLHSPVGPENQPQEAGPKAEPGTEVPNPVLGVKKQRWETFKDWFKSLVSSKPKAKPDADSDRFEVMRDPATGEMILKRAWKAGDVHDHHDKTPEKTATPEPVADRFKSVRQEADLTHNHKKGHTL
ncbi:MobA/MobL family protein [Salmonella enterica subsp. enterica serovar Muenchen]